MTYTLDDQVIALAGLFQACQLVDQIARSGYAQEADFQACLESIPQLSPESVIAVFGDIFAIRTGLLSLKNALSNQRDVNQARVVRYALSLTHLEAKLNRDAAMQKTIQVRVEQIHNQCQHLPVTHENVVANIADLYTETLSNLQPRIQVNGDPRHLQAQENANKIRALLLAGMRSAVLWRQTGGRRWQFIFQRKKLLDATTRLLAHANG